MSEPHYRIVTIEQYVEGFYRFDLRAQDGNGRVGFSRHDYTKVRWLPDGNVLVLEPLPADGPPRD